MFPTNQPQASIFGTYSTDDFDRELLEVNQNDLLPSISDEDNPDDSVNFDFLFDQWEDETALPEAGPVVAPTPAMQPAPIVIPGKTPGPWRDELYGLILTTVCRFWHPELPPEANIDCFQYLPPLDGIIALNNASETHFFNRNGLRFTSDAIVQLYLAINQSELNYQTLSTRLNELKKNGTSGIERSHKYPIPSPEEIKQAWERYYPPEPCNPNKRVAKISSVIYYKDLNTYKRLKSTLGCEPTMNFLLAFNSYLSKTCPDLVVKLTRDQTRNGELFKSAFMIALEEDFSSYTQKLYEFICTLTKRDDS